MNSLGIYWIVNLLVASVCSWEFGTTATQWGGQPLSGHKVLSSALSHADVVVNSFVKWYFDDACVLIIFSSFRMICAC